MMLSIGCRCMQLKTGIRINGNVTSIKQYFFDFCPGDAVFRMLEEINDAMEQRIIPVGNNCHREEDRQFRERQL